MPLGPYQINETVRIPLETTVNGVATEVTNPRIQTVILPSLSSMSGFPKAMTRIKAGAYYGDITVTVPGTYIVIINATLGAVTIEEVESFVVEDVFTRTYPRISAG
jgi:hypothetical protein